MSSDNVPALKVTRLTTCQICGKEAKSNTGFVARHGFKREKGVKDEDGNIIEKGVNGQGCPGSYELPFEVSRDVLGPHITNVLTPEVERWAKRLADFDAEPDAYVPVVVASYERDAKGRVVRVERVAVSLNRADFEASLKDAEKDDFTLEFVSYDEARLVFRERLQGKLVEVTALRDFHQRRYDTWEPVIPKEVQQGVRSYFRKTRTQATFKAHDTRKEKGWQHPNARQPKEPADRKAAAKAGWAARKASGWVNPRKGKKLKPAGATKPERQTAAPTAESVKTKVRHEAAVKAAATRKAKKAAEAQMSKADQLRAIVCLFDSDFDKRLTVNEIIAKVGLSRSTVMRRLDDLVTDGYGVLNFDPFREAKGVWSDREYYLNRAHEDDFYRDDHNVETDYEDSRWSIQSLPYWYNGGLDWEVHLFERVEDDFGELEWEMIYLNGDCLEAGEDTKVPLKVERLYQRALVKRGFSSRLYRRKATHQRQAEMA